MTAPGCLSPQSAEAIATHAATLAAQWPPLTAAQLDRVALMLRPSPLDGGAAA